jgi:hypothetical protein
MDDNLIENLLDNSSNNNSNKDNSTIKYVNNFNKKFYISILAHLILIPFSDIFYIQWLNSFIKYPWIFNAIFLPLSNIFFFGLIMLYYRNILKSQFVENSKNVSRSVIIKLALMNLASNYFFVVSIPNISILLYIILNKFSILFLFVLSYLYLRRRYYVTHYIGIFITLCGISMAIYSSYQNSNNENNNGNNNSDKNNAQTLSIILFIFGVFINNISHVYKEKYIKTYQNLNIFWLYFWVNLYQIIFGILSMPIIFIPNTRYYVDIHDLSNYFVDSMKSQYLNYFSLVWMFSTEITCCALALIEFNIVKLGSYVGFNIIHSFTIPLITLLNYLFMKYNILYYSEEQKFIFKFEDYISLASITIGSIIYFWKKEFIIIDEFPEKNNNKIDNNKIDDKMYDIT